MDNDLCIAHENAIANIAEFMLKGVSQPMTEKKNEKKMTSDETYTMSLLGLCEFFKMQSNVLLYFLLQ